MLYLITSDQDQYFARLKEDPVRPAIDHTKRIGNNRDIFVLKNDEDNSPTAITCVSYQDSVPTAENELFDDKKEPDVAVFYTIWSYKPGAGRDLILNAVNYIKNNKPNIARFVTLSPPTEIARRFHLKNGAQVFRENKETVNYEYTGA
jgi:hypothetical protein